MIVVSGLEKRYRNVHALRGVSFEVPQGAIVGLLGRNGAGKTTTLQCIAGITRPDQGTIVIAGQRLDEAPIEARRRLAFIPDEPEFFDYLTVDEHMGFFRQLYPDAEVIDPDPLSTFGLEEKRGAFPDQLSRGMRQKLAMACTLWRRADAVLLDRTAHGPRPFRHCGGEASRASAGRTGSAVLLSSHLLHLVRELCSRIVVIERGAIVADQAIANAAGAAGERARAVLLSDSPRSVRFVTVPLRFFALRSFRNVAAQVRTARRRSGRDRRGVRGLDAPRPASSPDDRQCSVGRPHRGCRGVPRFGHGMVARITAASRSAHRTASGSRPRRSPADGSSAFMHWDACRRCCSAPAFSR